MMRRAWLLRRSAGKAREHYVGWRIGRRQERTRWVSSRGWCEIV